MLKTQKHPENTVGAGNVCGVFQQESLQFQPQSSASSSQIPERNYQKTEIRKTHLQAATLNTGSWTTVQQLQ